MNNAHNDATTTKAATNFKPPANTSFDVSIFLAPKAPFANKKIMITIEAKKIISQSNQ
jgi:hypothetical protein